jgi:type IX secretion system substrate protein/beta-propeller repeat-containing protein
MKKLLLSVIVMLLCLTAYAEIVSRVMIYNGPANGLDQCNGIVQDKFGKVYATGVSWGGTTKEDYATVKFSEDGDFLWAKRFDGTGHNIDIASAIAIDDNGNIYVTGWSRSGTALGSEDYCTIKYNSDGVQQWVKYYDGANGVDCEYYDYAKAICVDDAGNVYVTGISVNSSNNEDYATVKYSSGGTQLWVKRYNGPSNLQDEAFALFVDDAGNVYVTGGSQQTNKGYDYLTVKYSSAGTQLWTARYDASSGNDIAAGIKVDAYGSVFVAGTSYGGPATKMDYATIKYNSAGVQQWLKRNNGTANDTDAATSIDLDVYGNAYVTGYVKNNVTGYDYTTIKYLNFDGTVEWNKNFADTRVTTNAVEKAWKVKVVSKSCAVSKTPYFVPCWIIDIYVTGQSNGASTGFDYLTLHYAEDGALKWANRYNGSGTSNDAAFDINVRDGYPIMYAGGLLNNNFGIIGITETNRTQNGAGDKTSYNYPNPFNPETKIFFNLDSKSHVRLSIYDAIGQEVKLLASGDLEIGGHSYSWNASNSPSGIYFYRLETNQGVETKKIVLIK